ncbi:MAG: 4Fe-4S binding protein [Chloroflexi bacterium]|nr:4Fe-4S binding protein [Chloroflexota bacterium]
MAGTVFSTRLGVRKNGNQDPAVHPSITRQLQIDYDRCCSCGACVAVCPPDALFLKSLNLTVDQAICTSCERCIPACPVQALSLIPKT